jgi:aspartate aminotransferase-like enzyme
MLLLNPGPVTLTERVRRSLLQADLCHRESEFYDLQDEAGDLTSSDNERLAESVARVQQFSEA